MTTRRSVAAWIATCACTMLLAFPVRARETTLDLIDALRTHDCARPLSSTQKLHADRKLDAAAGQVATGLDVNDALKRADIRVTRSAVIQVTGDIDASSLKRMLHDNYCQMITDARLTTIGIARSDRAVAIVLATPFAPPRAADAGRIARDVLQRVNEARATARRCGNQRFGAARPVTLSDKLNAAAAVQAKDLAAHGPLSHTGSDGSSPADRVGRFGYAWKTVGENVAGGQETPEEVVAGWLTSPEHCMNIMNPDFTEMGIAYVVNPKQKMGIYWAQVFGRPL